MSFRSSDALRCPQQPTQIVCGQVTIAKAAHRASSPDAALERGAALRRQRYSLRRVQHIHLFRARPQLMARLSVRLALR